MIGAKAIDNGINLGTILDEKGLYFDIEEMEGRDLRINELDGREVVEFIVGEGCEWSFWDEKGLEWRKGTVKEGRQFGVVN